MLYTQIRAFDAVAHAGTFVAAAEALGVSQPALSMQVRALEEAYGLKLFQRAGRTLRLTEPGKQLFQLTRRFMSLEEQINDLLSSRKHMKKGRLKLAFDGPHITMPLVRQFQARYPGIDLSISMGNSRFVRQQLFGRHVDLAVLPGISGDPRVHSMVIRHHLPRVIVAREHPWADRPQITIHDLEGQPMVAREAGSHTQKRVDEGLAAAGVVPKVVLRLGSREAVIEAAAANLGIAIIWECEALNLTVVRAIPLEGTYIDSTDYLACLSSEAGRQSVKSFFAVARL